MLTTTIASRPALTAAEMANTKATSAALWGWRIIKASARNSAGIMGNTPSKVASADKDQIA